LSPPINSSQATPPRPSMTPSTSFDSLFYHSHCGFLKMDRPWFGRVHSFLLLFIRSCSSRRVVGWDEEIKNPFLPLNFDFPQIASKRLLLSPLHKITFHNHSASWLFLGSFDSIQRFSWVWGRIILLGPSTFLLPRSLSSTSKPSQ
jgi:hypothetical protein